MLKRVEKSYSKDIKTLILVINYWLRLVIIPTIIKIIIR